MSKAPRLKTRRAPRLETVSYPTCPTCRQKLPVLTGIEWLAWRLYATYMDNSNCHDPVTLARWYAEPSAHKVWIGVARRALDSIARR